jgi:hypothetical protein
MADPQHAPAAQFVAGSLVGVHQLAGRCGHRDAVRQFVQHHVSDAGRKRQTFVEGGQAAAGGRLQGRVHRFLLWLFVGSG